MRQVVKSPLIHTLALWLLLSGCSAALNLPLLRCNEPPRVVEFRYPGMGQQVAFESISKIAFTRTGDLEVWGWSKVPQPQFTALRIGRDDGKSIVLSKMMQTISPAKCGGMCQTKPFSESPNGKWQLALAYSTSSLPELWLLGNDEQLRLNNWLPHNLKWEWSDNSQAIWLTWAAREAGSVSVLILLGNPVKQFSSQSNSNLFPASNRSSFSPSKLEFLIAGSTETYIATGRVTRLKVQTNDLTQTGALTVSHNLIDMFWDTTLNKHLLVFADGNGLKIESEDGTEVAQLSKTNYDLVFGKDTGGILHNYFSNGTLFAISPDGKRLAIERGPIYVFTCKAKA